LTSHACQFELSALVNDNWLKSKNGLNRVFCDAHWINSGYSELDAETHTSASGALNMLHLAIYPEAKEHGMKCKLPLFGHLHTSAMQSFAHRFFTPSPPFLYTKALLTSSSIAACRREEPPDRTQRQENYN
jgi:hypothetical protein